MTYELPTEEEASEMRRVEDGVRARLGIEPLQDHPTQVRSQATFEDKIEKLYGDYLYAEMKGGLMEWCRKKHNCSAYDLKMISVRKKSRLAPQPEGLTFKLAYKNHDAEISEINQLLGIKSRGGEFSILGTPEAIAEQLNKQILEPVGIKPIDCAKLRDRAETTARYFSPGDDEVTR